MGYAGYVPAKLPPSQPTKVQEALWSIESFESLELLTKLIKNAALDPREAKFRKIKTSNPKIKSCLIDIKGGLQTLTAMGWTVDPEDADCLIIPQGKYFSMADVRLIQEAEVRLKNEQKYQQRATASKKGDV